MVIQRGLTMNNVLRHKALPYAVKKRLLLSNAYYLPKERFNQMITDLEHDYMHTVEITDSEGNTNLYTLTDMQYCIHTVDKYGDWMTA